MNSTESEFVGGPLDGRVLPVLVGLFGNPPKTYSVPVPGDNQEPPVVYVYQRVVNPDPAERRYARWRYEYDPVGRARKLRWPWSPA